LLDLVRVEAYDRDSLPARLPEHLMRRCLVVACVLALLPGLAHADDVFLKGGGKVTGRVLSRTANSIEIDIGPGRVTLSMNSVERIEEGRSSLDEYHDRAAALRPGDSGGWLQLARWAAHEGLYTQARVAYERVLDADPGQAEANRALGRVELDGRWVTEEESYRARGYVRFEGAWITSRELDTTLRERAAVAEAERARLDAEQRAREAEARAIEAEARAREAFYQPVLVTPTIPGWFGGRGLHKRSGLWSTWEPWNSWSGLVSWNSWELEHRPGFPHSTSGRPSRTGGAGSPSGRTPSRPSRGPAARGSGAGRPRR
jgi:hypothetical protein